MIKREELTNPNSCMSKAKDDEMTFVLLGRDAAAPVAIRTWAMERVRLKKNAPDDAQIQEALACADSMDSRKGMHKPYGVSPDLWRNLFDLVEQSREIPFDMVWTAMLDALDAMLDVQSSRRHPLGLPTEGIAYAAAYFEPVAEGRLLCKCGKMRSDHREACPTPAPGTADASGDFNRLPWPEIIEMIGRLRRVERGEVHFSWRGRNIIATNNGGELNLSEVVPVCDYSIPFGGIHYSGSKDPVDIADRINQALEAAPGTPIEAANLELRRRLVVAEKGWADALAARGPIEKAARGLEAVEQCVELVRDAMAVHRPLADRARRELAAAKARPAIEKAAREGALAKLVQEWIEADDELSGSDNSPIRKDVLATAALDAKERVRASLSSLPQEGEAGPDYKALYHELLYHVGVKHPGESRHETALRYIRNAEKGSNSTQEGAQAPKEWGQP